jgi:hypothetical protein
MDTDALNRRLRSAAPSPTVRRLVLTEADYLLFEAIRRHGPLPSHYLYELTKHARRDRSHLQNRLTEFYNGDANHPYLTRPPRQFASFKARYQHLVYDLAPRARQVLAERATKALCTPKRSDEFVHQLMQACVAASIELTAPANGLRYISRNEILSHPSCPATTQQAANPMAIPTHGFGGRSTLIPDDLFGLEYPGQGYRFFALEIDRGTESIERKDPGQTAFGRKVDGYLHILKQRVYRDHWGIRNLHVITVTTNTTHARNILDYVRRRNEPEYARRFGMVCEPCFGANWEVPNGVLTNLLEAPWATPGDTRRLFSGET